LGGSAAEIGASEARAGVMSIEDFVEVVRAKHLYKSCMVIQESCGVDAPWRDGSLSVVIICDVCVCCVCVGG
jgi:hypothetical protein